MPKITDLFFMGRDREYNRIRNIAFDLVEQKKITLEKFQIFLEVLGKAREK